MDCVSEPEEYLISYTEMFNFCIESLSSAREHACQNSVDILSKLYDNVCQLELVGDCRNAALFIRLLQQSIWPFLINLECWMTGQSLDSEFEFMVQAYA